MKNESKFIRVFCLSAFVLFGGYFSFFSIINPYQTSKINIANKYTPYHLNFILHKIRKLTENKENIQSIILGSSTSEAFLPADMKSITGLNTFSASTGGGATPVRYTFFKKAIQNLTDLKLIIYVSDLFEFNQPIADAKISYPMETKNIIQKSPFAPSFSDYLKHIFNNQTLEGAFEVLKRTKKNKMTKILDDGTTTRSMILSPVESLNGFEEISPLNQNQKLLEQIKENTFSYKTNVLFSFTRLNNRITSLVDEMSKEAEAKKVQMVYILAPYHKLFKDNLFQDDNIKQRYEEWVSYLQSKSSEYVKICTWPLQSKISSNINSAVWRDGIHFNRKSAIVIAQNCLLMDDSRSKE